MIENINEIKNPEIYLYRSNYEKSIYREIGYFSMKLEE